MISVIITAFVSFASTNIDDIFVLMVFFSQISEQTRKHHIIMGQYLGIAILLFVSILGSAGLNLIPQQYTGGLGVIPIFLGIREWIKYKKEKKAAGNSTTDLDDEIKQVKVGKKEKIKSVLTKLIHPAVLNVSLVTIANGADNIGVYIPLFMKLNTLELIMTITIFILLIALWCFIGEKLISLPGIKHSIQKYKNIIVPILFILIGVFILVESDFFILLFEKFF